MFLVQHTYCVPLNVDTITTMVMSLSSRKRSVFITILTICVIQLAVKSSATFLPEPTKASTSQPTRKDILSSTYELQSTNKLSKKKKKNQHLNKTTSSLSPATTSLSLVEHSCGGAISSGKPSMYWAVLHNWLYFLSLGFNLINVPFMIRLIVDGDNAEKPSSESIALSGKVESVDKFLTFLGVGFLSALSDRYGRKPLMAWSAMGFMITNLIQANAVSSPLATAAGEGSSIPLLYLADFVDGCSSCMLPLCQAYVSDCSSPKDLATNLGIFQGLSGK